MLNLLFVNMSTKALKIIPLFFLNRTRLSFVGNDIYYAIYGHERHTVWKQAKVAEQDE